MLTRRLVGLVCVALLLSAAVGPCAGWDTTPEARRDCCERNHCQHGATLAAGEGTTQADADRCCANGERGTSDRTERAQVVPVLTVADAMYDVPGVVATLATHPRRIGIRPPGAVPRHLLFSILQV